MGTKSSSNKNKTETQDTTSLNSYTETAMVHRARGQKETSDLGHSEVQDSCPFWLHLLGSAAGTGRGGCWGAGQDPSSHSEAQVTDWSAFVGGDVAGSFQRERHRETSGAPTAAPPPPHAHGEKVSWAPPQKEFMAFRSQHTCIHMA